MFKKTVLHVILGTSRSTVRAQQQLNPKPAAVMEPPHGNVIGSEAPDCIAGQVNKNSQGARNFSQQWSPRMDEMRHYWTKLYYRGFHHQARFIFNGPICIWPSSAFRFSQRQLRAAILQHGLQRFPRSFCIFLVIFGTAEKAVAR